MKLCFGILVLLVLWARCNELIFMPEIKDLTDNQTQLHQQLADCQAEIDMLQTELADKIVNNCMILRYKSTIPLDDRQE